MRDLLHLWNLVTEVGLSQVNYVVGQLKGPGLACYLPLM